MFKPFDDRKNVCGGSVNSMDENAPKSIACEDITLFDVSSVLGFSDISGSGNNDNLGYINVFASPAGEGTFMFCESRGRRSYDSPHKCSWALVKENIFPKLAGVVRECNIASGNGRHHFTHGLPENFGGSINIEYASGEKISISNNQSPILSDITGRKIYAVFENAMQGEKISLPNTSDLISIRFNEERKDGGFTRAELILKPDGSAVNKKTSKYDSPTVYESEKEVDAQTVSEIKKYINSCALFAWQYLPERSFFLDNYKKTITFVFSNGNEIKIKEHVASPFAIQRGFFNIELEMTTKH